MRFQFDKRKSEALRKNPHRGIGFEEAQQIFEHPYYVDERSDDPTQLPCDRMGGRETVSMIFEIREDRLGEYYHLVTLWRATRQERKLYEENS